MPGWAKRLWGVIQDIHTAHWLLGLAGSSLLVSTLAAFFLGTRIGIAIVLGLFGGAGLLAIGVAWLLLKRTMDLYPRMRVLRWQDGDQATHRKEYREWVHAVFRLGGTRKQRVRAFIETGGPSSPNRIRACIAGPDWYAHEVRELRPGDQFHVPVFLHLSEGMRLWFDERQGESTGMPPRVLGRGCYLTDELFLDGVIRDRLPTGAIELHVVLITGDTAHQKEHSTSWRTFSV